jgi:hypothetical protein
MRSWYRYISQYAFNFLDTLLLSPKRHNGLNPWLGKCVLRIRMLGMFYYDLNYLLTGARWLLARLKYVW